jgi:hypothetical protein
VPSGKRMGSPTFSPKEFLGGQREVSEIKKAPLRLNYGPCKAIHCAIYEQAATKPKWDLLMSVASKIVRSFEGLPLLPYVNAGGVISVGYGYTVGGPIDPDMEGNSEVEALPNVTWNLLKDEFVALLKRHLPKISIPL